MKYINTIVFLVFFSLMVFSQKLEKECIFKDYTCEKILDNNLLQVLVDTTNSLTINDINSEKYKDKFIKFSEIADNLQPNIQYWLRIDFEISENSPNDIVILHPYQISEINAYDKNQNGKYEIKKSGVSYYNSEKDLKMCYTHAFSLHINNPSETVYLRLGKIISHKFKCYFKTVSKERFEQKSYKVNFLQGVFQGLLWMIILYNIFSLFQNINKTQIYYVAFMFVISLYFFNDYNYLIILFDFLSMYKPQIYWILLPAIIFYIEFITRFLEIKQKLPKLNKFLRIYIISAYLFSVFSFPLTNTYFLVFDILANIYYILFMIIVIILIYASTKIKTKITNYFIAGMLFFVVGSFFTVLGTLGLIQQRIVYFQSGLIFQFFIFTLGLSVKRENEKKESQEKIINQLEENKKLQTKVNRELEQKVNERTREIRTKNEEITAQSEYLKDANTEIINSNIQLNEKNKQIIDSITYASRIQKAILGDISNIEKEFDDAFIFFSPHSIISGDFYWFMRIEKNNMKYKIIIAADCTGHGVPGAFMTVMGSDFIDEIVNKEGKIKPDEILTELDKKVTNRLRNQNDSPQVNDGMDISVLVFEEDTNNVYFAAAKNPLYYVSGGEMKIIKGSKYAIGGISPKKGKLKEFNTTKISIKKDDVFYIFSDGFQDQFGGKYERKYLKKRFRDFLHSLSDFPAKIQKQKIEEELISWKGNNQQTDDIIIIGINIPLFSRN